MSLRNIGGYISAAYNALAANVGPGVQTNQTEGVFTLQTAMQAVAANQWCTDPYFDQTTLLLQADNVVNASQNNTFIDSGLSNATLTPTASLAPGQGSFTPFSQPNGYWGNYFNVNSISSPSSSNIALGAGDFTIEYWVYNSGSLDGRGIFQTSTTTGINSSYQLAMAYNNATFFVQAGAGNQSTTGVTVVGNRWYHLALVKTGATLNLYVDGVNRLSRADTFTYTDTYITVGGYFSLAALYAINGYVSNFRVTKGGALYTANFIPSTLPLTTTVSVGTVQFLTCQSNRFVDNSANNFALTKAGTPLVQLFSPFAPVKSYLDTSIGGSVTFNGTNNIQGSSSVIGTAGNFTIEYFGYFPTATPSTFVFVGVTTGPLLTFNGSFYPLYGRQGTYLLTGTIPFPLGEWGHCAVVRFSGTTSMYVNGLFAGSVVGDNSDYSAAQTFGFGGGTGAANLFSGSIISNYRMVNTALYSGTSTTTPNFTIPTAPFTNATANTRILFSAANGSVIDAALKSNLRTMGNAQISTSVKKYGSGSMVFDGTGDYIHNVASPNFALGAGDFTIECWIYPTTITGSERGIFGIGTTDPDSNLVRIQQSTSKLQFWLGGSNSGGSGAGTKTGIITCATVLSLNTWYHIALVRNGSAANNVKLYLNGVVDGQGSATYTIESKPFGLGMGYPSSAIELFIGNIDDFRITKGIARYTSTFTPPKIAFAHQ